jgi:hypothetical protein
VAAWGLGVLACAPALVACRIVTAKVLARVMTASKEPDLVKAAARLRPRVTAGDVVLLIVVFLSLPAIAYPAMSPSSLIPPVGVILLSCAVTLVPTSHAGEWALLGRELRRRVGPSDL